MLHQNPRSALSLSDEYETPHDVFNSICEKYEIIPLVDVCATVDNAVKGRIRFLHDGSPSEYVSRNSYMCVIFRKS